ncbi:MAG: phosphoglucomutase/phosphomannomutase family protein [Candidatus Omnitrophica bacterium]|nr:phosphoglucomutase/phosphomannomutase family protein [Candidatus Omnitrophota bacterium]
MPGKLRFGTDGWRAIVGEDFNLENVSAVAQAVADYLTEDRKQKTENRKIAVGYDTRRLSKEAAQVISQVLTANKIKVILSDRPLPTQAVSYAVRRYSCSAGIMVTASHNPARFNGIKLKGEFGGSVESELTGKIEQLIFRRQAVKISFAEGRKKKLLEIRNLVSGYLKFIRAYLKMPLLKQGRFKILVDAMHGTADSYIAQILKATPIQTTTIHQDFDSTFGGVKPEPIAACLGPAAALIKRRRFALGLATDGDADRIAALDEHGKFISPQQILALLLLHFIRYRKLKGAVVKTIAGTSLIERIARKHRLPVYETPVGFKHISLLMQTKDILIGGEEAGGIGFKDYLPERDGILAGLLLVEMLIAQKKSISALLKALHQEFGPACYLRRDLRCLAKEKVAVKTKIAALRRLKNFLGEKITKIKDYDGLKFYLASGSWILFRLSGTEPLLRIYAEAQSLSRAKELLKEGRRLVSP